MTELSSLAEYTGLIKTVVPHDQATPRGAVTGGWILTQLDLAAGLAGRKLTGGDALIVAIDKLVFHARLTPGAEFVVNGLLVRRGTTSFNLHVSAVADPDHACLLVVSAEIAMVAVDSAGKPRKLAEAI